MGEAAASLLLCVLFIKLKDKQADMRDDSSVVQLTQKNAEGIVTRTEVLLPTQTEQTVGTGI